MGKREEMGKKLDSWFGRGFKASNLRSYLNLTVSRVSVLRNPRRTRWEQARSDVAALLRQGNYDRAVLRAEYIIKEQNMLDVFDMVECYCQVLSERADLLVRQRDCPEELREAISSLIFAGSRCGQLYELHEVRSIIASKFGKDFVSSAVELRTSSGVNSTIIEKLSTKNPSLEMMRKAAKDLGTELGIELRLREPPSEISTETQVLPKVSENNNDIESETLKVKEKYEDATSAAQAAYESAAYAAVAAKAAIELSRSESQNRGRGGSSGQSTPRTPKTTNFVETAQRLRRTSTSGSESSGVKSVVSGDGELPSPASSKSGDIPWRREKLKGYDPTARENISDEEGSGKWKGVSSHRKPYAEDNSSSEDDEITRREPLFGQRVRQGAPKQVLKNWEEEEEVKDVQRSAGRQGWIQKEDGNARTSETLMHKRTGLEKRPVSMRTRRSAF